MKSFVLPLAAALFGGVLPLFAALDTGSAVPELEIKEWVKGSALSLGKLQKDGKITVLFFWTISQQGTADFDKVAKLANELGEKDIQFAAIACDGVDSVKKFFRLKELPFPVAADDVLKTTNTYMRRTDRVPLFAVINKDGKLVWRGGFGPLPEVIRELREGKFDLAGQVEREKFAETVAAKMREKDYDGVVSLLDGELKKHPGNLELIVLKARVMAMLQNKVSEAAAFLKAMSKDTPKAPLYDFGAGLFRAVKANRELSDWYTQATADLADQPMLLIRFARQEIAPKNGMPNLAEALKLITAAKASKSFKDDRERGIAYVEAARLYYFCGRPDLALRDAKEAAMLLKKTQEYNTAKEMVLYYNQIVQLSRTLK